jgi:peptidoglycan-associated lipoprotein
VRNLLFIAGLTLLLTAGCSTQGSQRGKSSTEGEEGQKYQRAIDEAVRQARARQQERELQQQQEERKRRESAAAQPQVKPLVETSIAERTLSDPAGMLKDASSPLSKRSVYYDYDAYDIQADYQPMIEAHAQFLREHQNLTVRVEGNCDERGSREYNLALGQRRADSIKRALTLLGVPAKQVSAVSLGAEKPRTLGREPQDYAENRRSDLIYVGIDAQN